MSTQEKIILTLENVDQFLAENFDGMNFVSTMSDEKRMEVVTRAAEAREAGDMEKYDDIMGEIPLDPRVVLWDLVNPLLGMDFLAEGFNLADVDKAFGADWREKFEVNNGWV
ncbi:MAG: hypothetical protein LIQ31_00770 [Planctomycetes bacterium]|nr:hypothetical protein [Planctomycetota bacterium]